jgi:hypothetical protein
MGANAWPISLGVKVPLERRYLWQDRAQATVPNFYLLIRKESCAGAQRRKV